MGSTPAPVQVDDRDPRILYSGDWYLGGNTAPNTEFDGTTHGALSNGSTIQFSFEGTSITVYGTVSGAPTGPPSTSSFALDNGVPVRVTTPQPDEPAYRHTWYASGALAPGQHTLVISADDTQMGDILWFDYLEYVPVASGASMADTSSTGLILASALTTPPPLPTGPASSDPTSGRSTRPSPIPTDPFSSVDSQSSSPTFSASAAASLNLKSGSSTAEITPSPTASSDSALSGAAHQGVQLAVVLPAALVPSILLVLVLLFVLVMWRRQRRQMRACRGSRESILGESAIPWAGDITPNGPECHVEPYTPGALPASSRGSFSTPESVQRPFLGGVPRHSKESVVMSYAGDAVAPVVRHPYVTASDAHSESPPAYGDVAR